MKHLLSALIVLSSLVQAQTPAQIAKWDSLSNNLVAANQLMGTVAIAKGDKIIYSKNLGDSRILDDMRFINDDNTLYRIGSISKTFTAVMIYQLIEEGKLSHETRLNTFFPQIENANTITIAQMLNHSSGIHNFTDDTGYVAMTLKPWTHDELQSHFETLKSDFEPGSQHSYSNTAYVLLGYIIEKIDGNDYNTSLLKRIAKPLQINIRHGLDDPMSTNEEALSYVFDGTNWIGAGSTHISIPNGAGALVSRPEELCHFAYNLFTEKVINESSLKSMTTIQGGYGHGLFQYPFGKRTAFGHTGGIDGFTSMLAFFPEDSMSIAYCANGVNTNTNSMMIGYLSIYYEVPYTIPTFEAKGISATASKQYIGDYSSPTMPMDIKVFYENGQLKAQATGQSSFPLDFKGANTFEFAGARIKIVFDEDIPSKGFTLYQGGMEFKYLRKNG